MKTFQGATHPRSRVRNVEDDEHKAVKSIEKKTTDKYINHTNAVLTVMKTGLVARSTVQSLRRPHGENF